jgi:hypothetical protein
VRANVDRSCAEWLHEVAISVRQFPTAGQSSATCALPPNRLLEQNPRDMVTYPITARDVIGALDHKAGKL